MLYELFYNIEEGFPGGPVDKNLPANAEDMGSIPSLGRFHMRWNNSARAPHLLSPLILKPVLHNQRSHHNEQPEHHKEEELPLATTREQPKESNEDPTQLKIDKIKH